MSVILIQYFRVKSFVTVGKTNGIIQQKLNTVTLSMEEATGILWILVVIETSHKNLFK